MFSCSCCEERGIYGYVRKKRRCIVCGAGRGPTGDYCTCGKCLKSRYDTCECGDMMPPIEVSSSSINCSRCGREQIRDPLNEMHNMTIGDRGRYVRLVEKMIEKVYTGRNIEYPPHMDRRKMPDRRAPMDKTGAFGDMDISYEEKQELRDKWDKEE
jgi:hypothetical protein